ncbi:type VI secretion system baseplate subunit TssE [Rhodobacter sp. KR11]|jgi:type VI secretion system protein ImpF|uniref:type VI secretion system baseplate subunit TssE n=1 Tax=Rhodobacter sp. KR11 TaxID=2974588 RepID=UPI0022228F34|nr:type VI secretion system baseplate subunit TssE [Rhodobacter sp. KR11]MCW1917913.1 type VI secretion system baseplate subunit TssE [Rhodobacter sp. KR11]
MADRMMAERLQPSLLDRLTDDDPTNPAESREARVIDIRRLREIVQRDLSWLLNTNNSETWIDPERYPLASKSVLNYGVREVAGDFAAKDRAQLIRKSIAGAIEAFEPRIRRGSAQVEIRSENVARQTVISFDIRADMWAEPIPIELYLRSSVDVTTGEVSLERAG